MATIDVVKSSMLDAIIDTFTENKVNKMIRIIRIPSGSSNIRKCISPETTTALSCVCIKTISKHGSRGQKNCRRYECTLPLPFITSCCVLYSVHYEQLFRACSNQYQGEGPTGILLVYPQHCLHLIEVLCVCVCAQMIYKCTFLFCQAPSELLMEVVKDLDKQAKNK